MTVIKEDKYLVVTKGLAWIREATGEKQLQQEITFLKQIGYKKPMIYVRV